MALPKKVIVEMKTPYRGVWWAIDLIGLKEDMERHHPDVDFETYIRPLPPFTDDKLDEYNGNHCIFGEIECIGQSDNSPAMFLYPRFSDEEGPTTYEVHWEN